MEEVWDLSDIKRIQPIGQDWLKTLLLAATETQRAMMLMTFWRIWHAHNELTHGKECPSIDGSRRFLVSYLNSLMVIKQFPEADIGKGKMVVDHRQGFKEVATKERTKTIRPRWKQGRWRFFEHKTGGIWYLSFSGTRRAMCSLRLVATTKTIRTPWKQS
jgi:hypothetical protein